MKKLTRIFAGMLFLVSIPAIFLSCNQGNNEPSGEQASFSKEIKQNDVKITSPQDQNAYISYNLQEFAGKTVTINFSADMKVINNSEQTVKLMWQVMHDPYPIVAQHEFKPGTTDFITVKTDISDSDVNNKDISLGDNEVLYLSTYKTDSSKISIELKNVKYTVSYVDIADSTAVNWLDDSVPSLYETYKDDFDYVGLACEYSSWAGVKELVNDKVCTGLKKHVNTITMGNEFKPDGFFGWGFSGSSAKMIDFNASNGLTIKVPASLNYSTVDNCLAQCKKHGLQMRGHVLVWHSQTPDNFFTEDYVAKTSGELITNLVSKEVMSARQEWYIKTVLEHVAEWEAANNDGKHIVWAWDVVNEAMADDASTSVWLRGSTSGTKDKSPSNGGSRWYQIYKNEDFIVDAFRYANAYAPADVKLCYNDYNEYMNYSAGWKTDAICKIIDKIQNGAEKTINGKSVKPRIDVMGMQSHVGVSWPGISGYETAIKAFLKKGVDIHVTELDVNNGGKTESAKCYGDYFTLLQKYGNSYNGSNKIECVTIWGINNKSSWISNQTKYPLLFDNYKTTDAFWKVIDAAE